MHSLTFRRIVLAKYNLLYLIKLMNTVNTLSIFAVGAGLTAIARRVPGISQRQF